MWPKRNEKRDNFGKSAKKQVATQLGPLQKATETLNIAIAGNVVGLVMDCTRSDFNVEVLKLRIKCQTVILKDDNSPEQRAFEEFEKDNSAAISDALSAAAKVIKQIDPLEAREILQDALTYTQFCRRRAEDNLRQVSTAAVYSRLQR